MVRRRRKNIAGKPRRIDDAIWALVRSHVPGDSVQLLRLRSVWPKIAGEALARRAWPDAVSGDEAIIAVHDNQWLHELTYMRQALLRRIVDLAPNAGITRVRLRLAQGEPPPPPPVDPPIRMPPRAPPLPVEPDPETVEAIHAVADDELRAAIAAARQSLSLPPARYPE
ncbi:MAG: DUF721 domain-containing protein [Myxococcales bacterium]|nr:DUF721 domain-containing protein [Myxococcales bacterium]